MFQRISHIRDFGVYRNLSGRDISDFKSFNLIYGWNYSGKTTLSRLFRCLEKQQLHPDYPNAEFTLTHADGSTSTQDFQKPCVVRVFNDDFRRDNLLWDDADGFNPIFMLGSENIENQALLQEKIAALEEARTGQTTVEREKEKLQAQILKAETNCATQIVKELGIGRFDRRHLKPIIESWGERIPAPLSDAEFHIQRTKISAEEKQLIEQVNVDLVPLEPALVFAKNVLMEQIGDSATIERLVSNPRIGKWVEDGVQLHADSRYCEFCGGEFSDERRSALNAHFSKAFELHLERIKSAISELQNRKISFNASEFPTSAFYADLQTAQADAIGYLSRAISAFNDCIVEFIDRLEQKISRPFDVIDPPSRWIDVNELVKPLSALQAVIVANNDRTNSFAAARDEAIEILKSHYTAEAMRQIDRFALVASIEEHEKTEGEVKAKIGQLNSEIVHLQSELSKANAGAEIINATLRHFFGKSDLEISVTENNRFLLKRGSVVAKNLSEGERTAIAFCYFVTKLSENGNDLGNTIVYIDDPISSLDAHHLIHISSFIRNTFYEYNPTGTSKHRCLAKQLFISTHNLEFFHLVWGWLSKVKKDDKAAFLIERTDSDGVVSSRIVDCPNSILVYRSEYLFLFQQLVTFRDNPSADAQVIFNIGNMARRFVEGYLSFKFFESSNIDASLSLVISDPINCDRARRFMHHYSHTLSRHGGMYLPDMSDAKAVVSIILDSIKSHDPIHFASLNSSQ